jgi:hypothetical protein
MLGYWLLASEGGTQRESSASELNPPVVKHSTALVRYLQSRSSRTVHESLGTRIGVGTEADSAIRDGPVRKGLARSSGASLLLTTPLMSGHHPISPGDIRSSVLPVQRLDKCAVCSNTGQLKLCSSCGEVGPLGSNQNGTLSHHRQYTVAKNAKLRTGQRTRALAVRNLPVLPSSMYVG